MFSIPVALDRLHTPLCAADPELKVHPDTGKIRTDSRGNRLWTVSTVVRRIGDRRPALIDISTAIEPHGITAGTPLCIIELDAAPWTFNGYSAVAFKAAQILPSDHAGWEPAGPAFALPYRSDQRPGSGIVTTTCVISDGASTQSSSKPLASYE